MKKNDPTKPYFDNVAERTGLSRIVVIELLNKGWRYHEGIDMVPCWQHPSWQTQEENGVG